MRFGFFSSFTCEADASTPMYARMNDAKITSVSTLPKSGTNVAGVMLICDTPPVAK